MLSDLLIGLDHVVRLFNRAGAINLTSFRTIYFGPVNTHTNGIILSFNFDLLNFIIITLVLYQFLATLVNNLVRG